MNYIGLAATVLTIMAFLPQTFQVVKTRKTRDISLTTYATLIVTSSLWTLYGFGSKDTAIYITNIVICICCVIIVIFKLKEPKAATSK